MNALPQIKEATSVASRDWHAVLMPFLGFWEPVLESDGRPLMFAYPGPARSAASGYRGTSIFMGRSPVPPTIEQIREAANPPRTPPAPVLDVNSLDPWKEHQQHQHAQGTGSNSAWGR